MNVLKSLDVAATPTSGVVELTYPIGVAPWHNQIVISRQSATTGTLTFTYTLFGEEYVLKDAAGLPVTRDLSSLPDPICFDGLVASVIVTYSGINAGFSVSFLGQDS